MAAAEVFRVFLRLGLTSFGGPVAHIGYFRREFVERQAWIDEASFGELLALCQFLPGPASSQLGFAIGLQQAGWWGGLAAWCGFTLPSALLMLGFALGSFAIPGSAGLVHGLKLAAVAIVAQAVIAMARTLAPDLRRCGIAVVALALVLLAGSATAQLAAIVVGATLGTALCRGGSVPATAGLGSPVSQRAGVAALLLVLLLLLGVPLLGATTGWLPAQRFNGFYRSGALVFGGGHVVLPRLQMQLVPPGWVTTDGFLSGYALAQAVPGPLFSFATYLGAILRPQPYPLLGAAMATVAIFLPGLLLVIAALPFRERLRTQPSAQAALRGTNAAVVGILAAALWNPVWVSAIAAPADMLVAGLGFATLMLTRASPLAVVVGCALAGLLV